MAAAPPPPKRYRPSPPEPNKHELRPSATATPRRQRRGTGTDFQVVFLVDASGSMATQDVDCRGQGRMSRISAVFDAIDCFAEAMVGLDDVGCTLAVFNNAHSFHMRGERADASVRAKLRGIGAGVRPQGGGLYLKALAAFEEVATEASITVGVLLSDGVPSEDMLDADCVGRPHRERMLATMRQLRQKLGRKCVLHTVGLGSFNPDCLQKLAEEGGGAYHDNSVLDAGMLRTTFRRLFATVSTLRSTVLAFGAGVLKSLPAREMEPADAWRTASPEQLNEMREEHLAWIMLPPPGDPAGDLQPAGPSCRAALHRRPFAEGSLRYAFHFFVFGGPQQQLHLVIKEGKYEGAQNCPRAVSSVFLTNHTQAQAMASEYKRACMAAEGAAAKAGAFVPALVIKLQLGSGEPRFVTAERYIEGDFVKMNGNDGYINRSLDPNVAEAVAAFSHFTFQHSGGRKLCVDIQGSDFEWTDPQFHSLDKEFGPADLGREGMRLFFSSHVCGRRCRALGLRQVDPETLAAAAFL